MDNAISNRIIIVDDHPIFLRGLAEVIKRDRQNAVVDLAHSGEEAIRLAKLLRPHMMIFDIEMPGINGLEAARLVNEEFPEIKLVILSMHNSPAALDIAMQNNVHGYVLKENAVDDIRDCIKDVLDEKNYVSPQMRESLRERGGHQPMLSTLTFAERNILNMIADNMTTRSIAEELFISEKTVSNHRHNIATKLGLKGQHMLLRFALEHQALLV